MTKYFTEICLPFMKRKNYNSNTTNNKFNTNETTTNICSIVELYLMLTRLKLSVLCI